jgi:hypothetical protein
MKKAHRFRAIGTRAALLGVAISLLGGAPVASAGDDGGLAPGLPPPIERTTLTTAALLDTLQHTAFDFFWEQANPSNGLIRDRWPTPSPCSIASVGFGLSAICIGIDHGWITREEGRDRVLTTLDTFWTYPQGPEASGKIGYQGLFYHFLDMNTGERVWNCELSTIDTALLFAGIIDAREYFDGGDPEDVQVRALADSITHRADWDFMRNGGAGIRMGWKPGTGFAGFGEWVGYNEAMILYLLAIGSPTHPVPAATWIIWTSGYSWQTQYGYQYVIFPPLFGHQYSHCWIDFRSIQDSYMQTKGITYFENSRRATLAQREYCIANPGGWTGYGPNVWGITASDTPTGYMARGAPPPQNDEGTITPTAVAGSIPFAPGVTIPTLHHWYDTYRPQIFSVYGFVDAFNLTVNWWDLDYIGIDQGPIVIMIENYRTGKVWERFMGNADVQAGLLGAGFAPATDVPWASEERGKRLVLRQNAPNPIQRSAQIAYHVPTAGPVSLVLYDVAGRRVRTLVDERQSAGEHVAMLRGEGLPSGTYFYRLEANGEREGKQCVIIR